ADLGLDTDEAAGEADKDWGQAGGPRQVRHLPAGSRRGPAAAYMGRSLYSGAASSERERHWPPDGRGLVASLQFLGRTIDVANACVGLRLGCPRPADRRVRAGQDQDEPGRGSRQEGRGRGEGGRPGGGGGGG